MMLFWTLAAVMIAAALALLLRPLLSRCGPETADADALNVTVFRDRLAELERSEPALSPEEYRQARSELERELLADTAPPPPRHAAAPAVGWAAPVIGILVPALAVGLYLHLGSPNMVVPPAGDRHEAANGATADDMRELTAQLRARLQRQPDDVEGWLLLARTLVVMERHAEAAEALRQARRRSGDLPALLTEEAEILALAREGEMAGEPAALVERALALDPAHPHALWLAGLGAAQRQRFEDAVDFWTRLLAVTPEGDDGRMIRANIQRARAAMARAASSPEPGAGEGAGQSRPLR